MKKNLFTIAILAVIVISFITFSGCEKKDIYYPSEKPNKQLYDFFKKSFDMIDEPDCFIGLKDDDTCIMINSMEDLYRVYGCGGNLPHMDFTEHSVVVGKCTMPNLFYKIHKQYIIDNGGCLTIKLFAKLISDDGSSYPAINKMYYYGIYPKLPNKSLNVELKIDK